MLLLKLIKQEKTMTYSTFEQTPIATNYADFQHTMFVLFQGLDPELDSHYWELWNNKYDTSDWAEITERKWNEFLCDIAYDKLIMENIE